MTAEAKINYATLLAHPLAEVFDMIKGREFDELAEDIRRNGILTAITLYDDGGGLRILDGRNRFAAAKAVGHAFKPADFTTFIGTVKEAEAYANSVNVNRRHLTTAQKRAYIERLIGKYPKESSRQIARVCGFSHVTVEDVRRRLANPPELKRFEEFKRTFDGLSDDRRLAFAREFEADLRDLLAQAERPSLGGGQAVQRK